MATIRCDAVSENDPPTLVPNSYLVEPQEVTVLELERCWQKVDEGGGPSVYISRAKNAVKGDQGPGQAQVTKA